MPTYLGISTWITPQAAHTGGLSFLILSSGDLPVSMDEEAPLAWSSNATGGYGGAGEMGHAREPTELSAQDIRVASPGHFNAASPTILSHDQTLERKTRPALF
jgi:hypothetical protein